MGNHLEQITKIIYREHKQDRQFSGQIHPPEEDLVGLLENTLKPKERRLLQKHLLECDLCAECLAAQLKIQPHLSLELPASLLEKVKKMVQEGARENLLEVFLQLKEKALQIIHTTGDVLFGQELVPAPVLRSRNIHEFKEEISILKDLQQVRVMAKIQSKTARSFNLSITVTDKESQKAGKGLRVALIKDSIELESYVNESGSSFFEDIQPGEYLVEINRHEERVAVIDLKVKT